MHGYKVEYLVYDAINMVNPKIRTSQIRTPEN